MGLFRLLKVSVWEVWTSTGISIQFVLTLIVLWVAMGGVWVTSEATALIDATVTAVAGVHVSVWRKRSGATDFWRADADFLWLGRCAMA